MSKRVRDWTSQDVMVWLTKNMSKLSGAESLRVYVQMQNIDGETFMGYTKSDSHLFGLVKESDFEKILKKLQSHDEKMEKDKKKKPKRKTFFRSDNRDSGVDDNCSVSEEQGVRQICVNSDSPGSANTSGTGSFMSMSGGSIHKNNNFSVQAVVYEKREGPKREVIPEATYMAPEDEEPPPSRPVPPQPHLPDPDFEDTEATYENFEPAPPPPAEEEEWEEQPDYLNLQEAQEIQDGEPEDIYVNQESESSSSEEESSDEEGNQEKLADIQRRLTLAMADLTGKKETVPSRPPLQPPASGPFGKTLFARGPAEPPLKSAPETPIPAKPSRDLTSPARDITSPARDVPQEPPLPKPVPPFLENKPDKRQSVAGVGAALHPPPPPAIKRQSTSPSISSPETVGGMSIKERMAMLDKGKNSDPPPLTEGGGSSIKDRQSKIAGLFGGPPPPAPPPARPPVTENKPAPVTPPSRNPPAPIGLPPQIPPSRPSPPPPPASDLPPPPPPPLSGMPKPSLPPSLPPSNSNMSRGCYEDNEITFPPPLVGGRSPLPPPTGGFRPPLGGFKPPSGGFNTPSDLVEDDAGLYTLEPEDDEDDNIYNDGDEAQIPGYLQHVTSRQMAEEILRNDPRSECYLIRDSTNNPETYPYVISLKTSNSFEHTRLGSRRDGTLAIGTTKVGETTHANLSELILHHKTTPLNLRGRNVLLRNPVQQ